MAQSNIVRAAVTTFILACVSSSAFAASIDMERVTASVDVKAGGEHSYVVTPVEGLVAGKTQKQTKVFDLTMHNDTPHSGYNVVPVGGDKGYLINGDSKIELHSPDMHWESGHWWLDGAGDVNAAFTIAAGEVLIPGTYTALLNVNTYIQ
ncbi:MyfA/PsaA family fimbrial adhesin [Edwardsiella tarda]|uniref:MyfA/PsaA family fimbrial adhesin n=1 Tax=Edwardsiella tarda TaxID=636 RepID=UPI000FD8DCCA|nr:MyfA/PsaA family fimbrial adhesin [Edwardsiella tarda]